MVRDLSLDGLFIESSRPYASGTRLECHLRLGDATLTLTGEVRHLCNEYRTQDGAGPYKGMGLRFVRLGSDELNRLRAHLARLTSTDSGS